MYYMTGRKDVFNIVVFDAEEGVLDLDPNTVVDEPLNEPNVDYIDIADFNLIATPGITLPRNTTIGMNHASLTIPSGMFIGETAGTVRNLMQAEYLITDVNDEIVTYGYIAPDNTEGMSLLSHLNDFHEADTFVLNFSFPSVSVGVIDPGHVVMFRLFLSEGSKVLCSPWSNAIGVYNHPASPPEPIAFKYDVEDNNCICSVQIIQPTDPYDEDTIKFIINTSYTDTNGNKQWKISDLLTGIPTSTNTLLLGSIALSDVNSDITVALYALFPYVYESKTYFTLSEISPTALAVNAVPEAPNLREIILPDDYHIYENKIEDRRQEITLKWDLPYVSNIPKFSYNRLNLNVYTNPEDEDAFVLLETVDDIKPNQPYNYAMGPNIIDFKTTKVKFEIVGVVEEGEYVSVPQSVNLFEYAGPPELLRVVWATNTPNEGEIDVLITFKPPTFLPYGITPNKYVVEMIDSNGDISGQKEVDVGSDPGIYLVDFKGIVSTPIGNINAYALTTNTNIYDNSDNQQGNHSMIGYQSSDVPIIQLVSFLNNNLEIRVTTRTPLVRYNQILYDPYDGSTEDHNIIATIPFESGVKLGVTDYVGYVADIMYTEQNMWVYNISFTEAWLEEKGILERIFIVSVSNTTGITSILTINPGPTGDTGPTGPSGSTGSTGHTGMTGSS